MIYQPPAIRNCLILLALVLSGTKVNALDSLFYHNPAELNAALQNRLIQNQDSVSISAFQLVQLAHTELLLGNYPLAYKHANAAMKNKSLTDTLLIDAKTVIAEVYMANAAWSKAKRHIQEVGQLAQGQMHHLAKAELLRAKWLKGKNAVERAREKALDALVIAEHYRYWEIQGEVLLLLADIYTSKRRIPLAQDCALEALKLAQEKNANLLACRSNRLLANIYNMANQIQEANQYAIRALQIAEEFNLLKELKAVYYTLYQLSISQENTSLALRYFQDYTRIGDSLSGVNKSRELAFLESSLALEKQKVQNNLLAQEKVENEAELARKKQQQWLYAGAALLLLISTIVGVVFYRNARKANKRLLRLAKTLKQRKDELDQTSKRLALSNQKLRQAQQKITQQKLLVEKASKAKDIFLSSVSHELRSPLNAILGLTEELLSDNLPKQQESLEVVKFSGENLLALVNDILDFNKIEAGKITLEQNAFDLAAVLNHLLKSHEPKARSHEVELILEASIEKDEHIVGDKVRITQVIQNLMSNAVKFTQKGKVYVRASIVGETDQKILHLEVEDEGIGIPHEKITSIFEHFTQASIDTTRKYGGTGLGLAITKKLVRLMGGNIWVKSDVGVGSMFTVKIPVAMVLKSEQPSSQQDDITLQEGMRILLVDDSASNRLLAQKIFAKQPVDFQVCDNAKSVLQDGSHQNQDIILTDIHMPDIDGFAFTQSLRDAGFKGPILAITGSVMYNLQEWQARGFTDFLIKPYAKRDLLAKVAQHHAEHQALK